MTYDSHGRWHDSDETGYFDEAGVFHYPSDYDDPPETPAHEPTHSEPQESDSLELRIVDTTKEDSEKKEKVRKKTTLDLLTSDSGIFNPTITYANESEDGQMYVRGIHTRGPESTDPIPFACSFTRQEIAKARSRLFPDESSDRIV